MRWCLPYTRECSFHKMVSIHHTDVSHPFSFTRYAPRHTLVIYSWISSYNWALDQVLARSCPFMLIYLPQNSEWKFSTLSHVFILRWNCGSKLIKFYLDTSHFEPWWFIAWASLSEVFFDIVHTYSSHKNLTTLHCCISLHHTMRITTAP
jgi:hypothetical protein